MIILITFTIGRETMRIIKAAVSTSLAIASLVLSANASALPGLAEPAPESSVKLCVTQIGEQANYEGAVRVRHEVDSKARRISGHKIYVTTTVFGSDSDDAIREYATVCAVSDKAETKKFRIKEKSI
jgi:hypothetical protein